MDFTKEVWHCELYRLQNQSPKPIVVKCNRQLEQHPVQYGDEYHGNIDRNETDIILSKYTNGAFLIRDSQRNVGAFTLVIRFDETNKNYVLFYNPATKQHYVGSKYFDDILDLVQDGLIHMYIESRGADILRQIAEAQVYEATPFFRTKLFTLNEEISRQQQHQHQQHQDPQQLRVALPICDTNNDPNSIVISPNQRTNLLTRSNTTNSNSGSNTTRSIGSYTMSIEDYNGSCDSGIFNSLKSTESLQRNDSQSQQSPLLLNHQQSIQSHPMQPQHQQQQQNPAYYSSSNSSRDISPQLKHKSSDALLTTGALPDEETPPIAPTRRKSLYTSSLRLQSSLSSARPSLPTEMMGNSTNINYSTSIKQKPLRCRTEYEPIFPQKSPLVKQSNSNKRCSVISNASTVTMTNSNANDSNNNNNNQFRMLEKPHNFKQHNFIGPQWCDLCAHFMWGLVSQGLRCDDCGMQAHKKCAGKAGMDCCPVMKRLRRVYGVALTSLGKMENRGVPCVLTRLITELERRGLAGAERQGLYRVPGNLDSIEIVRALLDKDVNSVNLQTDPRCEELTTLTGLIKLFLRQLPIPLITLELYERLVEIYRTETNPLIRNMKMRESMGLLNSVHHATLKYFMTHLNNITKYADTNCMTSSNLAIIFAPTLISKPQPISNNSLLSASIAAEDIMQSIQSECKYDSKIISILIENVDTVFVSDDNDDTESSLLDDGDDSVLRIDGNERLHNPDNVIEKIST